MPIGKLEPRDFFSEYGVVRDPDDREAKVQRLLNGISPEEEEELRRRFYGSKGHYGGGGQQPWTPARLTGLAGWWKANASNNLIVSGAFSRWTDQSGNARHMIQNTVANRPAVATSSGETVGRFDGTNDVLTLTSNLPDISVNGVTAFAIFKETTHVNGAGLFGCGSTGDSQGNDKWFEIDSTFSANSIGVSCKDTQANPIAMSRVATNGAWHWLVFTASSGAPTNDAGYFNVDGSTTTDTGTTAAFPNDMEILLIGHRVFNAAALTPRWTGDVFEIGLLPRVISAEEIAELVSYLTVRTAAVS